MLYIRIRVLANHGCKLKPAAMQVSDVCMLLVARNRLEYVEYQMSAVLVALPE